jgi:hypothetical protein
MREEDEVMGLFHNYTKELKQIAAAQISIAHSQKQLVEIELEKARFLHEIAMCVCKLVVPLPAKGFKISQLGGQGMAITGIPIGGMGSFKAVTDPPESALQAGNIPVWTSDDPLSSLTPSADGLSVNVAVANTDTGTSLNLTISGIASDGTAISTVTNVPLLPAAVTPAKGFVVSQTA